MPIFAAIGMFMISRWVFSVLTTLGVTYISIKVIQMMMDKLYGWFQDGVMLFPQLTLELLGLMNVDLALNVVIAAWYWRVAISIFTRRLSK